MELILLFLCLLGFLESNVASEASTTVVGLPAAVAALPPEVSSNVNPGSGLESVEELMELDLGPISPLTGSIDDSLLSIIEALEKSRPETDTAVAEVSLPTAAQEASSPLQTISPAPPENETDKAVAEVSLLTVAQEASSSLQVSSPTSSENEPEMSITAGTSQEAVAEIRKVDIIEISTSVSVTPEMRKRASRKPKSANSRIRPKTGTSQAAREPNQALTESNSQELVKVLRSMSPPPPPLKPRPPSPNQVFELLSPDGKLFNSVVNLIQLTNPGQLPSFQHINPNRNAQSFVGIPLLRLADKRKFSKYPHSYGILQPVGTSTETGLPRKPVQPVPVHPIPITTMDVFHPPRPIRGRGAIRKRSIPISMGSSWQSRPGPRIVSRTSSIGGPRGNTGFPRPSQPVQSTQYQFLPRRIQPIPPNVRNTPNSAYQHQQQQFVQYNFNTAPQGGPPAFLPRSYGQGQNEPWITAYQSNPQFQRGSSPQEPPTPKYVQGFGSWPNQNIKPAFTNQPLGSRSGSIPFFRPPSPLSPSVQHVPAVNHFSREPNPRTYSRSSSKQRTANEIYLQPHTRGPSHNNAELSFQDRPPFKSGPKTSESGQPIPGNWNNRDNSVSGQQVNPYNHYRSHGTIFDQTTTSTTTSHPTTQREQALLPSNSRDDTSNYRKGNSNSGTSQSRPFIPTNDLSTRSPERPSETHPSPEKSTYSILPDNRRPMPFYSQAEVDGHYRRVLAHNETKKDNEFEDADGLLQWYLQRAKQVLRQRHSQNNDSSQARQENLETGGQTPTRNNQAGDQTPTRNNQAGDQTPTRNNQAGDQTPTRNHQAGGQTPTWNNQAGGQTPIRNSQAGGQTPTWNNQAGGQTPIRNSQAGDQTPTRNYQTGGQTPTWNNQAGSQTPTRNYQPGESSQSSDTSEHQSPRRPNIQFSGSSYRYPSETRTDEFTHGVSAPRRTGGGTRFVEKSPTGYVFNGTSIQPNGGIVRLSNEHHARHSVPRRSAGEIVPVVTLFE